MVDLTPGYIVSAVVGFSFVQRDSFDDVKEDDVCVTSLIAQAFGFFEMRATSRIEGCFRDSEKLFLGFDRCTFLREVGFDLATAGFVPIRDALKTRRSLDRRSMA